MKKYFWLLLFIGLALLQLKPYFTSRFPYTHDGENHLARFANYKLALKEGQVPPRFAPNLLNRYGYPVFNYNYPLANVVSLPFSALKLNYEITFKLLVTISFFAGMYAMKKWGEVFTHRSSLQALSVTTYATAPYLASTILFRGNIGEIMSWALLPWVGWWVSKLKYQSNRDIVFQTIGVMLFALLLLSHNIFGVFGSGALILFGALNYWKKIQKTVVLISVAIVGWCLTAWFWLPALLEKHLTILDSANLSQLYADHFTTLSQLLFSSLEFGFSYPGRIDSLSFAIGYSTVSILCLSSAVLLKILLEKKSLSTPMIVLGLAIASAVLQLELTKPLWNITPFVNFIQFPWRLGLFTVLFSSILIPTFTSYWKTWMSYCVMVFILFQTIVIHNAKPVDYFHKTIVDYDAFSQTTSTANENLPLNFTYTNIGDWAPTPQIISGSGSISVEYWKGSDRAYNLNLNEVSAIVEPTAYFLGWNTVVDTTSTSKQKVEYIDNPVLQGRIAYELPAGEYRVRSRFTQNTWPKLIGNTLSIVTACILAVNLTTYLGLKWLQKNKIQ